MKFQKIQVFICIIILGLIGSLFSPALSVKSIFGEPYNTLASELTESNEKKTTQFERNSSFFELFTELSTKNTKKDIDIIYIYPLSIIIAMIMLFIIMYFRIYKWLFTLGFVFTIFTTSCLYNLIALKTKIPSNGLILITYGFGWIILILIGSILTLVGFFLLMNDDKDL